MFGSKELVANLLKEHVGKYVNVDPDNVAVSLWSGKVELENLALKTDALQALNLPVKVIDGRVSKLSLIIPWKSLSTEAVVLSIEDIFCTVEPSVNYGSEEDSKTDNKADKQATDTAKAAKGKLLEDIDKSVEEDIINSKKGINKGDEKTSGFLAKLITKVVNNLQIKIKNLHIQLRDQQQITPNGFAFGIILQSIKIVSTNEKWKEVFVEGDKSKGEIYKVLELKRLGVYFACGNPNQHDQYFFKNLFSSTNGQDDRVNNHPYFIIRPISLMQQVKIDNRPSLKNTGDGPKVAVTVGVQEILLSMSKIQYQSLLEMLNLLDKFMVKQKYVQTRPKCPIKGKANVRLWWLFAYNAVLEDFRAEKKEMRRRLWIAMKRVRYSNLYKATLCANELVTKDKITVDGWNELIALELDYRMTEKDIRHLRKLCEAELLLLLEHFGHRNYDDITVKERIKMPKSVSYTNIDTEHNISRKSSFKKMEKSKKKPKKKKKTKKTAKKSSSWSIWGSMKNAVGYGDDNDDDDDDGEGEEEDDYNNANGNPTYSINGEKVLEINDEVRKQAFETVGFDPEEEEEEYHPSFVLLNLNIMISNFGIRLCQKEKTMLKLDLKANKFFIDYRQGSKNEENKVVPNILIKSNINDIQIIDCMNTNEKYCTVLAKQKTSQDLLAASFDIEPLNDNANSIVNITLRPQEIIVTKGMLDRAQGFFASKTENDLDNLKKAASSAVAESAQARRQRIEELIASRYIMKLKVELNAPLIKIPSAEPVKRMLVLDLGQFVIGSDDNLRKNDNSSNNSNDNKNNNNAEITSVGETNSSSKDDNKYDHFLLQARNITATIIENPENMEKSYTISIFETKDTLNAKMQFCRLPADVCKDEDLTQIDVDLKVPQLHLVMSEETLKKLLDILLNFDGENGVPKKVEDGDDNNNKTADLEDMNVKVDNNQLDKKASKKGLDIESILPEDKVEKTENSFFKCHIAVSLSAFDFDWKEAVDIDGGKKIEFVRVFGMSLKEFDVILNMDNVKQHIQVSLTDLSMTQYSLSVVDGKEHGLNIICIKPHKMMNVGNTWKVLPLCDLLVPSTKGDNAVPTQAKVDIGLVQLDCNAYRLFKLLEVYQSIIKSLQIKPPDISEIELPDAEDVDDAVEGGSKALINIQSFVVNLSCHENGLERPVVRAEISDLILNFFSYEDGGKMVLRTNIGVEHFDTHAVVWQPTFEPLLFHVEGRFPKSDDKKKRLAITDDDAESIQGPSNDNNLEFSIRTESEMKLSVTVALIKDLGLLGGELSSLKNFESPVDVMENFKPYILHNNTGAKVQLWFPMTDEFAQSEKTFIEPYDEYKFGLPIERQTTSTILGLGQQRSRINFIVDGYKKIRDISIDTLGEHYYILESDDSDAYEYILKWTVMLNAGAREITASSALSLKNCTPWTLEAQTSASNVLESEHAAHSYKILPGQRIYAPVTLSNNCRLDVKLLKEDTEWGVVHAYGRETFHGINAPLKTFRNKRNHNVGVSFRKRGIPLYGMVLHSVLGEHSEMFHHVDLYLYPAATIRNNLAQKITLVMQDATINEPTEMRTILPGEEFYPMLLRRDIDTANRNYQVAGDWHPLRKQLQATHFKFLLGEYDDAPFLPLCYPKNDIVTAKEEIKHNVQVLDDTGNEVNFKVHYSLISDGVYSSKIEIFCPFWIVNQSGLPLVFSKPQERKVQEIAVAPGQSFPVVEEVFENQRYFAMIGWTARTLPSERHAWSDKTGGCKDPRTLDSVKLPNQDFWEWQNDWTIDMSFGDDDGWTYTSVNFRNTPYRDHSYTGAVVRRRRWIRTRKATDNHSNLKCVSMYGPTTNKSSMLRMRVWDSNWSDIIDLNAVGTSGAVAVTARDGKVEFQFLISISIPPTPDLGETKLVTIVPRFVLVNNTKSKHKLYIGQYDRQEHYKMHHGHTGLEFENQKPFHWSDRRETKKITVMIEDLEANGDNGTNTWSAPFQIEEIGQYRVAFPNGCILNERNEVLRVEVKSTDSSIVIIFSVTTKDLTPLEVEQQRRMSQQFTSGSEVDMNESEVHFNLFLSMIELSMVDHKRTELLFLRVTETELNVSTALSSGSSKQSFELKIGEVEMDNMTPSPYFPVAFRSTKAAGDGPPFLHITIIKEDHPTDTEDIIYIPYFMFALQAVDVRTDERLLGRLFEMIQYLSKRSNDMKISDLLTSYITTDDNVKSIQAAIGLSAVPKKDFDAEKLEMEEVQTSKRLRFEILQINPLLVNLSFKVVGNFEVKRFDAIKSVLLDLENCPLRLNALIIERSVGTVNRLVDRIVEHYKHSVIRQLYKVIGSIGVLGAPIGFVGSLGSGVKSFFVEPAKAIRKGPKDFAKGMKKGTYGLLSNTFEGFGSAAGAVSGALGDGVAQLTFDEEFQASRQERDQAVAEGGFKNGVYYGGKAFASSFASGIKGLAYAPVKGAREGGISGFVKGVGKGIVGVPTKIVSGALEGVSHVAEGAANSAINQREGAGTVRKRAARAVRYRERRLLQGPERALVRWKPMEGRVAETLDFLSIRRGDADDLDRQKLETFLYLLVIDSVTALFVTTKRIYMIQEKKEDDMKGKNKSNSHRSSLKRIDTTNILWTEVIFSDSKFVIVANIVSLFSRLYEVIGTNLDDITQDERKILRYMVKKKNADPSDPDFGIPEASRISNWSREIKLARRISRLQHPRENIKCFTAILKSINETFKEKKKDGLGGADDLLPIIDYIACKSRVRRPLLSIKLIRIICDDEMQKMPGYAVTTFESAFVNMANK